MKNKLYRDKIVSEEIVRRTYFCESRLRYIDIDTIVYCDILWRMHSEYSVDIIK